MRSIHLFPLALLALPALAQSPTPRTAPRATWSLVSGVTGTPTQRRDNPGAASNTAMYLFGGRDSNANTTVHNALYEFNGTAWTLKTADTTAAGFPTARGGACVAWNFTSNKLVVFGGDTGTGPVGGPVVTTSLLGDTWEWDPVTNVWTDVTPVAGSPSARRFAAMTWDPNTGGMLMFGGDSVITPSTCNSDTWLFLGGAWVQLTPSTTPPVVRQQHLVTRPEFNDVIMLGGIDSGVTPNTIRLGVWRWNGTDWANLPTNGTIPHSVNANQAIYDQSRQRIVLQGGQGLGTLDAATYPLYAGSPSGWCSEWDSFTNEWTLYGAALASTNDSVIGRISRYFGAYVPSLGKIYKVGGQNSSGTGTITGTCQYQANPVAAATSYGTGCTGSAGPLALVGNNLPWTTRTFQATGSGFPVGALGFAAIGFTPAATPLSTLHPLGGLGCDLLVNPDVSVLLLPVAGNVTLNIGMPTATVFAGVVLNAQALCLEFDLLFNLTAITSSNALAVRIGAI